MNRILLMIGCFLILTAVAVPLLAGQSPGLDRPAVLARPGVLSSAIKAETAAQKTFSSSARGFVTIEGTRQGAIKGSQGNRIPFSRFEYEVRSPRDAATGQATGKRQHTPIRIVKEWDASTPLLFQALVTNEQIKTAKFEFIRINNRGESEVYHTVTLTGGALAGIRQYTGEPGPTTTLRTGVEARDLEEISFTFQEIQLTNLVGKTTGMDELSPSR